MRKTVTLRIDEATYALFMTAAKSEKRSLSNFIENAAIRFLVSDNLMSDSEMDEILSDENLLSSLRKGKEEIKKGKYSIVKKV